MSNGRDQIRSLPLVFLLFFFFCLSANSTMVDYISQNQSLKGNQTIVSKSGIFELGFFKPGDSSNYYIGVWYRNVTNVSIQKVVWVANRDEPIKVPSVSELKISEEGNLVLLDHLKGDVWSIQRYGSYSSTLAVLLDTGNLVLRDGSDSSAIFWQSFDHPTDTWLPGAELRLDQYFKTQLFTSWRNLSDPALGKFSFQIRRVQETELNTSIHYLDMYTLDVFEDLIITKSQILRNSDIAFEMHQDKDSVVYFTLSSSLPRLVIDYMGDINQWVSSEHKTKWSVYPAIQSNSDCATSFRCGAFSSCNRHRTPHCTCLPGFRPTSPREWSRGNWSSGCVRKTPLSCAPNRSIYSSGNESLKMPLKNFPLHAKSMPNTSAAYTRFVCLTTCSCTAYGYYRSNYYIWLTDLWYLEQTSDEKLISGYIYLRLQHPKKRKKGKIINAGVGILGVLVLLVIVLIFMWRHRKKHLIAASKTGEGSLVVYKYWVLQKVTKNFSEKLGGGSFGSVFKGTLPNSTAIAVKRLEGIRQGDKQFRSEVSTIGIIHHVNLLRLWGFCSEGTKRLLVYEYMKYGSLDNHLFHPKGSVILDWKTRFQVAIGTARGLAYLHEECRECIIHCDIKPGNILLDVNFQPKVADFGMAKLLGREFSRVLTSMRGTIGYLAPEWISGSAITPKADVYSYGMMLLEIISGRRNTSKFEGGNVRYFPVWAAAKLNEGEVLSLLDRRLNGNADLEELTRACRVACWCIQDEEADRPSMGKVVQILKGVVEVNIPPVSRRLLNLVGYQEGTVAVLDSVSDQSTQLHIKYGSCES